MNRTYGILRLLGICVFSQHILLLRQGTINFRMTFITVYSAVISRRKSFANSRVKNILI